MFRRTATLAACLLLSAPLHAATFVVTNVADSGPGSLRAAITAYNAAGAGLHALRFSIGSGARELQPLTALPDIDGTGVLLVDGSSQPGFVDAPLIRIDGGAVAGDANGLRVARGVVHLRHLAVTRFPRSGIVFAGGGTHSVQGMRVGTDGSARVGNGGAGIEVQGSGTRVEIGGSGTDARVLVACNGGTGISIGSNAGAVSVVNTHVGLLGSAACGNGGSGVRVLADGARIGGESSAERNVIAGNQRDGIDIGQGAVGTVVIGNFIGVSRLGTQAIGNAYSGIRDAGSNTRIGGGGHGNTISGNGYEGVGLSGQGTVVLGNRIGTNADATTAIGNASFGIRVFEGADVTIGGIGPQARNVISGNVRDGITIDAGSAVRVLGNHLGTDAAGLAPLGNGGYGVATHADMTTIGGTTWGEGNLLSGNGHGGIIVHADAVHVFGNRIGSNATGTAAIPNQGFGIRVYDGAFARIGDGTAAGRNLIAGNERDGVFVEAAARDAHIGGNWIGVASDGLAALPNGAGVAIYGQRIALGWNGGGNVISGNAGSGVHIGSEAQTVEMFDNIVGLAPDGSSVLGNAGYAVRIRTVDGNGSGVRIGAAGAGNVLSGNGRGMAIEGDGVVVQGNIVGLDAGATQARGNGGGIEVFGADNRIGGVGSGNVIAANRYHGVSLAGEAAIGNRIEGNVIGTNASGAAGLGNEYAGVMIHGGRANTIGGTTPAQANRIANNGMFGVYVWFGAENAILGNGMSGHDRTGIELEPHGPSEHDIGDGDHGPNAGQNAPELASATASAGQLVLAGRLRSAASTTYRIEWFHSAACSASGLGEGATFLGAADATTDADGNATLAAQFPSAATTGTVSATATDPAGNTSEFSACMDIGVPHGGRLGFWHHTLLAYEDFGVLETAIVRSGGTQGTATVRVVAQDGSARLGEDFGMPHPTLVTFAPGETIRNVRIPLVLDDVAEGNEGFRLRLVDASGAVVGAHGDVQVILFDHEGAWPFYGARDTSIMETRSGMRPVDVTITLSGSDHPVSIGWRTIDGTATAGEDYIEAAGIVHFAAGETEKTVQVLVLGDTHAEPAETFYVQIGGDPAGQDVIAGDSEAEIVIRDNPVLFADGFD